MNRHRSLLLIITLSCIPWSRVSPAELEVGDPAPALQASKWVRGKAVDISKGKGKTIFVVDFWSAQNRLFRHMLHVNNGFAARFRKSNVIFVGIESYAEKAEAQPAQKELERFADILGKKLEYTLAMDDGSRTHEAYAVAAKAKEGPHAFIIDKQGKIAWHGVPGLELWAQLGDLVGDKEFAEKARKTGKAQDQVLGLVAFGKKYDEGLALIDEILEFSPNDLDKRRLKYKVLVAKKKDAEAGAKWGKDLVAGLSDPVLLDDFATDLLTNELGYGENRDFQLALSAAKKANGLAKGQDWEILATLAYAQSATGSGKEAQETAKKALALARKAGVQGEGLEGLEQLSDPSRGEK